MKAGSQVALDGPFLPAPPGPAAVGLGCVLGMG